MLIISIGKGLARAYYGFHKIARVKPNRVSMISRQGNGPGVDFLLLEKALKEKDPELEVKMLCKTLDGSLIKKAGYVLHMAGPQMHALATSKVVVLDSYCIGASILPKRKGQTTIQMWHALGALKKFGRSILDREEGSSSALANAMNMHEGYDVILGSSEESAGYLAEAFGYGEDAFFVCPLPRVDLLRDENWLTAKKREILGIYPGLAGKKVLLYAPTFRKGGQEGHAGAGADKVQELLAALSVYPEYRLVYKPHPMESALSEQVAKDERLVCDTTFSSMEWLAASDWFISDYSALIYEAAVADRNISLFAYDKEQYVGDRGFYVDYDRELPSAPRKTADEVVADIVKGTDQAESRSALLRRFVADGGHNAEKLAEFIAGLCRE